MISVEMNQYEIMQIMGAGDALGCSVFLKLCDYTHNWFSILQRLDSMDIRGYDIFLCYDKICKCNMAEFIRKINDGSIKSELNQHEAGKI